MTEGCFDLYWLVVGREGRRSGVGRELLARVEETLQKTGARLIRVETAGLETYRAARSFYERCGYHQAACIDDFIGPATTFTSTPSTWFARLREPRLSLRLKSGRTTIRSSRPAGRAIIGQASGR